MNISLDPVDTPLMIVNKDDEAYTNLLFDVEYKQWLAKLPNKEKPASK